MVTPDYFKTYGIRLVKGRFFNGGRQCRQPAGSGGQRTVRAPLSAQPESHRPDSECRADHSRRRQARARSAWRSSACTTMCGEGTFSGQREEILVPFYQSSWTDVAGGSAHGGRSRGDDQNDLRCCSFRRSHLGACRSTRPSIRFATRSFRRALLSGALRELRRSSPWCWRQSVSTASWPSP